MCVRCDSPVAIVWHDVDLTNKQAVRAEIQHREKLMVMAFDLPDTVPFKAAFREEAVRQYNTLMDHYEKAFTNVSSGVS